MKNPGLIELLQDAAPPALEEDDRTEILARALAASDPREQVAGTVELDLRHHHRRRVRHLVLVAAVVVLLASGLAIVLPGGGLTGPITTPYRTARPLSSAPHAKLPHAAVSGSWQLVGDVLRAGWQQNTSGPPPADLTCPTTSDCYALAVQLNSNSTDASPTESLYVSNDFGVSWSVLPMPEEFIPNTRLSCADGSTCAVGGTLSGQAVLAETTDGGSQWTETPLSGIPGVLLLLSCSSAAHCTGVSGPPSAVPGYVGIAFTTGQDPGESAVTTSDGGLIWSSTPLPVADLTEGMACADATHCVIAGRLNLDVRGSDAPSLVEVTTDGGSTWNAGSVPAGFNFLGPAAISCGDATDCQAVGSIEVAVTNPPGCGSISDHRPTPSVTVPTSTTLPSAAVQAIATGEAALTQQTNDESMATRGGGFCTADGWFTVNDLAVTTDGGLTWTPEALPLNVPEPNLTDLACAGAMTCWAAGSEAVFAQIGNAGDAGTAVLLGTQDGGTTWSKVTFAVPADAPNLEGQSYLAVGSISCPDSSECLALGVSAQGSPTTPVYRYFSGS